MTDPTILEDKDDDQYQEHDQNHLFLEKAV